MECTTLQAIAKEYGVDKRTFKKMANSYGINTDNIKIGKTIPPIERQKIYDKMGYPKNINIQNNT